MTAKILREMGMSDTEIKVYLSLLELGSGLAGEITKKSGLNRTNVYDALERLIEKGLVSYVVKANRRLFQAVNPERLTDILKQRQEELADLMPKLQAVFKASKIKEEATIYKGRRGIMSIYDDILKEKKDLYVYGAERKFSGMFPAYWIHWQKERIRLKISIKIIWTEGTRKQKVKLPMLARKYLPKEFDFPSTVLVYGDKTVTVVWSEVPFGFMIKSKEVAKSNMHFFKILWKVAKK
ncbi:MAG: helix-turn-helix domain-containing protein [archaeon]